MVFEFRQDYVQGSIVIMASKRAKRIHLTKKKGKKLCPFDKGNEHMTPPTIFALPNEKDWRVRVCENAFPAERPGGEFEKKKRFFWRSYAYGEHELIIETERHGQLFQNFSEEHLLEVFEAYLNRFRELQKKRKIEYVYLFKNHGPTAGASIDHEHSQIMAMPFIPQLVRKELANLRIYRRHFDKCIFCDLIKKEEDNIIIENSSFVALVPSFGRFPYETWIIPKEHVRNFVEFTESMKLDYMLILRETLQRLSKVSSDYNIAHHAAPKMYDFHFHSEIYPRTTKLAGLELGAQVYINTKDEKEAVEELRKKWGFKEVNIGKPEVEPFKI